MLLKQFTVVPGAVNADTPFTIPATWPDLAELVSVTRLANAAGASVNPAAMTVVADAAAIADTEVSLATARTIRVGAALTAAHALLIIAYVVGGRNVAQAA